MLIQNHFLMFVIAFSHFKHFDILSFLFFLLVHYYYLHLSAMASGLREKAAKRKDFSSQLFTRLSINQKSLLGPIAGVCRTPTVWARNWTGAGHSLRNQKVSWFNTTLLFFDFWLWHWLLQYLNFLFFFYFFKDAALYFVSLLTLKTEQNLKW